MNLLAKIVRGADVLSGGRTTKMVVRRVMEPYGELEDFQINRAEGSLYLRLLLDGEKEPVTINVRSYEIQCGRDGGLVLIIHSMEMDRPWLNTFAEQFVISQRIEVPEEAAGIVEELLT